MCCIDRESIANAVKTVVSARLLVASLLRARGSIGLASDEAERELSHARFRSCSAASPACQVDQQRRGCAGMSDTGCRTVVSSGQIERANCVSSKPQTVKSAGTSRWRLCATEMAAAAMSSLLAKTAVGGSGNSSSDSQAIRPER